MNRSISWIIRLCFVLHLISSTVAYAMVAGGRANSISGGNNSFAGVVNPANAVWIEDRFDLGLFIIHQKLILNNKNDNPLFNPGKTNQTYKAEWICSGDCAIHKQGKIGGYESSFSLATYSPPGTVKERTKKAVPIAGSTPIYVREKTQVFSSIFSLKLSENHSIGCSFDYFYLSYIRKGFQNDDNPKKTVSPGHVTNNGMDHSNGVGLTLGWRWKISQTLDFGLAYIKKSYVGQYRKYRGFEVQHAKNYMNAMFGGGFTYKFSPMIAGRLEVIWNGYGNLPSANNAFLPNGKLNGSKRGSNRCSSSGTQDATFVNMGLGYKVNTSLSIGMGVSHRIKLSRKSRYIISHSYMKQAIYNYLSLGVDYKYRQHDFYLTLTHGLENHQSGHMPEEIGGGKFSSTKNYDSISLAWGYLY